MGSLIFEKAVKIAKELEDAKNMNRKLEDRYAALVKNYRKLQDNAERNEQQNKQIIVNFKEKAEELEEENKKVCGIVFTYL